MPVYWGWKKIVAWETEAKPLCPKVRNANQTQYVTSVEFGVSFHQLFSTFIVYPESLDVDSRVQTAHQELSVKGDLDLDMFVY